MKDWTGNKRSTWATLGASNHSEYEREVNDYYATDPSAAKKLLELDLDIRNIWEPACGEGHLAKVFEEKGLLVKATDLHERGYGISGVDFLKINQKQDGWIVTNPPYKYALEFCEKAVELGENVAMFLKITFLEGQKRKKFFKQYPPRIVAVFSKRVQVARNGDPEMFKKSSAACYAWYIWEKGFTGDPVIKWI